MGLRKVPVCPPSKRDFGLGPFSFCQINSHRLFFCAGARFAQFSCIFISFLCGDLHFQSGQGEPGGRGATCIYQPDPSSWSLRLASKVKGALCINNLSERSSLQGVCICLQATGEVLITCVGQRSISLVRIFPWWEVWQDWRQGLAVFAVFCFISVFLTLLFSTVDHQEFLLLVAKGRNRIHCNTWHWAPSKTKEPTVG